MKYSDFKKFVDIPMDGVATRYMRALQYLYYVEGVSLLSDQDYDFFCKEYNLFGGGGSDREADYSLLEKQLAQLLKKNGKRN
jgi:hypothetical protein